MKYKTKIYAKALAESLSNKKADAEKITDNFLKLLEKNNDIKKAKKIIDLAEGFLLKKTGNKNVILETARKTDVSNLIKSLVKEGDVVSEKINLEIVAGAKITINNEKQLDFSLIGQLNKIFERA